GGAPAGGGDSPAWIGTGAGAGAPWRAAGRRFVVTDEAVAAAQPDAVGADDAATVIAVPPGEASKTLATAERLWRALVEAGATRAGHVVGGGGGGRGDLARLRAAALPR